MADVRFRPLGRHSGTLPTASTCSDATRRIASVGGGGGTSVSDCTHVGPLGERSQDRSSLPSSGSPLAVELVADAVGAERRVSCPGCRSGPDRGASLGASPHPEALARRVDADAEAVRQRSGRSAQRCTIELGRAVRAAGRHWTRSWPWVPTPTTSAQSATASRLPPTTTARSSSSPAIPTRTSHSPDSRPQRFTSGSDARGGPARPPISASRRPAGPGTPSSRTTELHRRTRSWSESGTGLARPAPLTATGPHRTSCSSGVDWVRKNGPAVVDAFASGPTGHPEHHPGPRRRAPAGEGTRREGPRRAGTRRFHPLCLPDPGGGMTPGALAREAVRG